MVKAFVFFANEYKTKSDSIDAQLEKAKALSQAHAKAIDAVMKSKGQRTPPALRETIVITTRPGRLPLNFKEVPFNWRTKDDDIPQSEARWNYEHLTLLSGIVGFWDKDWKSSQGVEGRFTMKLNAYGNLAEASILTFVNQIPTGRNIKVKSDGLDEESALALLDAKLAQERADLDKVLLKLEAVKEAIEGIAGLFTAGAVIGYIFFGLTAALTFKILFIAGIIVLAATVLYHAIAYIAGLLFDLREPIIKTIVDLYPKKVGA